MKTDLFWPCGHCWVVQICWHIECSTFTASSFRIWNSSTGILSPPLALFIVMLSKAHLTSHSRMSGSRSVITLSWLSGSWRSFLYSSSVLNNSSECGYPCLVPDLRENAFSFSPLRIMCYRLIIYGLYYIEVSSFYAHLLKSFNHKWVPNFVKGFFCIYWDDHMFFFNFILFLNFT